MDSPFLLFKSEKWGLKVADKILYATALPMSRRILGSLVKMIIAQWILNRSVFPAMDQYRVGIILIWYSATSNLKRSIHLNVVLGLILAPDRLCKECMDAGSNLLDLVVG